MCFIWLDYLWIKIKIKDGTIINSDGDFNLRSFFYTKMSGTYDFNQYTEKDIYYGISIYEIPDSPGTYVSLYFELSNTDYLGFSEYFKENAKQGNQVMINFILY
jgi:hypothetical protein